VEAFAVLEPKADGFRNYLRAGSGSRRRLCCSSGQPAHLDRPRDDGADRRLRVLGANIGQSRHGVLTERPGTLTNDFFVHLLDSATEWEPAASGDGTYEARERGGSQVKWTATAVDLVFGSHSQLRAIAEVYASSDAKRSSSATSWRPGTR